MYLPPQFAAKDAATAIDLMRAHPFASLISVDDDGLPFVTHLPLHLEQRGDDLVLLGHCARPNPHGRYLQARPQAVVTFLGPHAYLSPKVYPDLARVPTWNYLAVHCTVQASLIHDPAAKDTLTLIDKRTLAPAMTIKEGHGKTLAHVEFTRDGRYALASVWEMDGAIVVYDARTGAELKRLPMSKPVGKYNLWNKLTRSEGTSH